MKQALGLVEIQGLSTAVVVADTMVKAANIQLLEIENTKGLGYMTIKIAGDVGAVNAAVSSGRQLGAANQKLVSWKVIPRPTGFVEHTFCDPTPPEAGAAKLEQENKINAECDGMKAPKTAEAVKKPETEETELTGQKPEASETGSAKREPETEAAEQKTPKKGTSAKGTAASKKDAGTGRRYKGVSTSP